MPTETRAARLAILIDADNSNPARLPELLKEIAKYGNASVGRAYGNWTSGHLGGWKSGLLEHSVQPMQQFNYTTGKNATDSFLIIDAMDLLYAGHLDGFCIVSSDSDFTRLAARIREQGLTVYGFGERKTPTAFVAACDKFVYTENLGEETKNTPKAKASSLKGDRKLDALLRDAMEATSDDNGWAHLGAVGSKLVQLAPDFDPRTYGYRKLKDLVAKHPRIRPKSALAGMARRVRSTCGQSSGYRIQIPVGAAMAASLPGSRPWPLPQKAQDEHQNSSG